MKKLIRFALLLAVIAYAVLTVRDLAPWAGKERQVPPNHVCQVVTELEAPEDFAPDPTSTTTPALLVAYAARRAAWEGQNPARGGLARFYPRTGQVSLVPDDLPGPFNTHGISVQAEGGQVTVFAVNHRGDEDTVEIFGYDGHKLTHQKTVRDPALVSLNDVAGAGGQTFYATNDHGGRPGLAHKLEEFGRQRWSNVVYFDGQKVRVAAEGLRYGNGVSVDETRVYVSESTGQGFWVYRRQPNGDLTHLATTLLGTALDNLTVEAPGQVLVAAHPNLLDFLRHVGDGSHGSPSQVFRLKVDAAGQAQAEKIWADDGTTFSAASVAAQGEGYLVIGQVFERGLLLCRTP